MCDIINIDAIHKRKEIEARYQRAVNAFEMQFDVAYRLMKAELEVKCRVVQSLRDADLRALGEDPYCDFF